MHHAATADQYCLVCKTSMCSQHYDPLVSVLADYTHILGDAVAWWIMHSAVVAVGFMAEA